jgi:choline dehydrogenase-like flavoprotein
MLRLDDTIQKREKTLNYSASLFHSNALTALSRLTFALTNWSYYWNRVPGDLRHIRREFKAFVDYHTRPQRDYVIYHGLEQAPNPNSRVSLGYPKDRFGLQQVRLDWQFCELDFHTFRTGQKRFAQSIQERGLGKVELAYTGDDARWDRVDGGAHHIGTTRMAARKQNGVVDADQRVFGTENLYVAGSSVFPTSGVANPTLTILATTLRLADKLSATTQ